MDLDALIAQITDEVCSRIQNERAVDVSSGFGEASTASFDFAGAMEYAAMDPKM